ncbi:MAG TPA: hypothetical protein DDY37_00335 [Legionella sp.]|nr:hypothetical protein [Legionella sp.]
MHLGQSMKRFAHDIQFTLVIKGILLVLLWVVCFKGAERNTTQASQWLFGIMPAQQSTQPTHAPSEMTPASSLRSQTHKQG